MIFLVLDVQSTNHIDNCRQLQAWVNVGNTPEAIELLNEELSLEGWCIREIIESTATTEEDYFAPCDSLDAFHEATRSNFSLRFK